MFHVSTAKMKVRPDQLKGTLALVAAWSVSFHFRRLAALLSLGAMGQAVLHQHAQYLMSAAIRGASRVTVYSENSLQWRIRIRCGLAAQDTRLSFEAPGFKSRWRNDELLKQHGSAAVADWVHVQSPCLTTDLCGAAAHGPTDEKKQRFFASYVGFSSQISGAQHFLTTRIKRLALTLCPSG